MDPTEQALEIIERLERGQSIGGLIDLLDDEERFILGEIEEREDDLDE